MTDNRKTTVPGASVGADAVQSSDKITTNIITNSDKQINLQAAKKSNNFGLNTVSMTELYDTVYQSGKPIVNDLLLQWHLLFVGAPKVGKSSSWGSSENVAYHVAMRASAVEYEASGHRPLPGIGGRLRPAAAAALPDVRCRGDQQPLLRNASQVRERGTSRSVVKR